MPTTHHGGALNPNLTPDCPAGSPDKQTLDPPDGFGILTVVAGRMEHCGKCSSCYRWRIR